MRSNAPSSYGSGGQTLTQFRAHEVEVLRSPGNGFTVDFAGMNFAMEVRRQVTKHAPATATPIKEAFEPA